MTDIVIQQGAPALVRRAGKLRATRTSLSKAFHRFLRAERARRELNGLTDRELGDMGLHRSNISAVAQGTFTR